MMYFGDGEAPFAWNDATFEGIDSGAANVTLDVQLDRVEIIVHTEMQAGTCWRGPVNNSPAPNLSAAEQVVDESPNQDATARAALIQWIRNMGKLIGKPPVTRVYGNTPTIGIRG